MLKNIGILTLYYNNRNYGAQLQSYALVSCINKMGYNCEQICLANKLILKSKKRHFKIKHIHIYIKNVFRSFAIKNRWHKKNIEKRNAVLCKFQNNTPHSKKVYTSDNIKECLNNYDAFITGSDQVWNMKWYRKEYFLDFVPDNIPKFSYSASMPDVNVNDEQKESIKKYLKSFDKISVREQVTADFLAKLTGRDVECVLDPTLLLEKEQWNEVCAERLIDKEYVFCYFLGNDKEIRKLAKKFAKKSNCTLVSLPHLVSFCPQDIFFADVNLYDVSPKEFISLIKHAKYVFTDSFHATVFSNLYKTEYFVFNRTDEGEMSSRMLTLLTMTKNEFRFCDGNKKNIKYLYEIKDHRVEYMTDEFKKKKNDSIKFLEDILINIKERG